MEKKFEFRTFDREQMRTLEKTHALLFKERESIEMDEFKDLYDVETDKKYVEELQAKMREEDTPEQKEAARIAEILELIYTDLVEKGRWMGDKAVIRITSIYDDIKNGIDMVTEFSDEGKFSHLGLAIDVTFSGDIRRKLLRIRREILSGRLAEVKYYLSEDTGIRSELGNIPHVIAGANLQTIKELSNLWFQKRQLSEKIEEGDQSEKVMTAMREKLKESIDDLKGHDFQHRVLRQIEFQLEKFIEFAKKEERIEVARKLQISLDKVREIMNLKGTPELEDVFLDLLEKEIELVFEKGEYGL